MEGQPCTGFFEIPAAGLTKLSADWIGESVSVFPYDGEAILAQEFSNRPLAEDERMTCAVEGGGVRIGYAARKKWLPGTMPRKRLTIQIPRALAANLSELRINTVSAAVDIRELLPADCHIHTVSGGVRAENLITERMQMKTVSGDVWGAGMSARTLSVQTGSGAVRMSGIPADDVSVKTISGSIEAKVTARVVRAESVSGRIAVCDSSAPDQANFQTTSGALEFSLPENSGFTLQYGKISGKMRCEFPSMIDKNQVIYGDGRAQYRFDTVSGNCTVRRLAEDSR